MTFLLKLNLPRPIKMVVAYFYVLWQRMDQDRITMVAGHLAYVSLLSLVPLVTVIFALFAAFPMFSEVSEQLKGFIFQNFMPATGDTIQMYLEQFVANSNKMTAVGICGLIVTALLLIGSIDNALNHIWRTEKQRPKIYSFAVYWMVLTLGPILAGGSMAISSIVLSQSWLGNDFNTLFERLLRLFPLLLSFATFWLVYSIVPNVRVPAKDAAVGALVAALLFELGKKVFSLYVVMFPSYQLIYGVLAVIPILFVWIYFSWCIVLFGAEVTASFQQHRGLRQEIDRLSGESDVIENKENESK
jgi:membrane protein